MTPLHFTTTNGTPALNLINGGQPVGFMGGSSSNAEAANFFIKLWWQKDKTAIPVIGTTAPDLTIQVPSAGLPPFTVLQSLNAGGACWYAATLLAADADTTALAGGDVVTLFLA